MTSYEPKSGDLFGRLRFLGVLGLTISNWMLNWCGFELEDDGTSLPVLQVIEKHLKLV